jgi:hypothetical protein
MEDEKNQKGIETLRIRQTISERNLSNTRRDMN